MSATAQRHGRGGGGAEADLGLLLTLAEQSKNAPNLRVATVDGTVYHDGGASEAEELAIATAVGASATLLNHIQFLTIRRYLSFVFIALVVLLVVLALWG